MNMRLLLMVLICGVCVSCATRKQGDYEIVYQERIDNDYKVFLLRHEKSVRFYIDYKNEPICEMEVSPKTIRAVVSPYLSKHGEIDNHTVLYTSDDRLSTVRWMTDETGTRVLYDKDGDGFPEMRVNIGQAGRVVEKLKPTCIESHIFEEGSGVGASENELQGVQPLRSKNAAN